MKHSPFNHKGNRPGCKAVGSTFDLRPSSIDSAPCAFDSGLLNGTCPPGKRCRPLRAPLRGFLSTAFVLACSCKAHPLGPPSVATTRPSHGLVSAAWYVLRPSTFDSAPCAFGASGHPTPAGFSISARESGQSPCPWSKACLHIRWPSRPDAHPRPDSRRLRTPRFAS